MLYPAELRGRAAERRYSCTANLAQSLLIARRTPLGEARGALAGLIPAF